MTRMFRSPICFGLAPMSIVLLCLKKWHLTKFINSNKQQQTRWMKQNCHHNKHTNLSEGDDDDNNDDDDDEDDRYIDCYHKALELPRKLDMNCFRAHTISEICKFINIRYSTLKQWHKRIAEWCQSSHQHSWKMCSDQSIHVMYHASTGYHPHLVLFHPQTPSCKWSHSHTWTAASSCQWFLHVVHARQSSCLKKPRCLVLREWSQKPWRLSRVDLLNCSLLAVYLDHHLHKMNEFFFKSCCYELDLARTL